ncbi:MAG: tail fiber domain-containing protein, partial [Flavobacteriales bacterium]|nr:tail fiber domain-containing protein [Flavobacteriales bacterium]
STAMGYQTTAPSYLETVIGQFNTTYTPFSTAGWNAADRLFVIGNGTGSSARSNAMVVLKNGNVGVGTSAPVHTLDVVGTAGLSTGTAWTNTSDMRLKENVRSYERGLKEILQINPIYYTYTDESGLKNPEKYGENIGISAQELQKIIPEAITVKSITLKDGTEMEDALELTKADAMWFALINAVKEQQNLIENSVSKKEFERLQTESKEQQQMLEEQNEKIAELTRMLLDMKGSELDK